MMMMMMMMMMMVMMMIFIIVVVIIIIIRIQSYFKELLYEIFSCQFFSWFSCDVIHLSNVIIRHVGVAQAN